MVNCTKEKMLMPINNNLFYKIKSFFRSLFHKSVKQSVSLTEQNFDGYYADKEEEILELQECYSKGKIKEEELTEEQMDGLCELYDKQIEDLLKSNAERKQKIIAQWGH